MDEARRHLLIGVLVSLFVTPFIGGGLVGYLNGYSIKRGIIAGAVVGAIVGLLYGSAATIHVLLPISQLTGRAFPGTWLTMFVLATVVQILVVSTVSGMVGGGIGSYVTHHTGPESGKRTTT